MSQGSTIKAACIELKVVNDSGHFSYDLVVKDKDGETFTLSNHRDRDTLKAEICEIFQELGKQWPGYDLSFKVDKYQEIIGLAKP